MLQKPLVAQMHTFFKTRMGEGKQKKGSPLLADENWAKRDKFELPHWCSVSVDDQPYSTRIARAWWKISGLRFSLHSCRQATNVYYVAMANHRFEVASQNRAPFQLKPDVFLAELSRDEEEFM